MNDNIKVLILAAGNGTRMMSNKPKVLHEISGKPMINHIIDTCFDAGIKNISIVLGNKKELIKQLELYPDTIQQAAKNYSPALIANYTYDLVKEFNSFYQNVSILGETNESKKIIRVQLANKVAYVIKSAFSLLGIQVPNRM